MLTHTTINTHHTARTERSMVTDQAVEFCQKLIDQALKTKDHVFLIDAGLDEHSIKCEKDNENLSSIIYKNDTPLVSFIVKRNDKTCKVNLHSGLDIDTSKWIGDFERCIAWAWIERKSND